MALRIMLSAIVGLAALPAGTALAAEEPEQSTKQLYKEAKEILRLNNVEARARIDVVFELAERLNESGRQKEALKYYKAGLRHQPWAMEHQLRYAKLLFKKIQGFAHGIGQKEKRAVMPRGKIDHLRLAAGFPKAVATRSGNDPIEHRDKH